MFDRRAIIPAGRVCPKRECLSQNRHFPQSFTISFHIAQIVEDPDQTLNKDLQQKCSWVSCPGRLATDKRHTFTTFDTLIGSILLKLDAFNCMHCIFTLFCSASTMSRLYVCWMFRVPSASISPIKNPKSYQHSRLVSSSITSRCFVSQICNLNACWSKSFTPCQTSEQLNRACSWKYTDSCNNWESLHCWTGLSWDDAKHVCLSSLRP